MLFRSTQRNGLSLQRTGRQTLLNSTAGNESKYSSYLADLQRKFNELQEAIWRKASGGYVSLGHVNSGDIIGYIGNSGYSTGCHVHFEIRSPNSCILNGTYYSRCPMNPASYIGNGYFIHPTPGVYMSAPYGFSSAYFTNVFHTGQDYADNCVGTPIRASAPGDIIVRVTGRPNTYAWSLEYGNYVMIRHTNGMYSLYGHMR